MTTRTHKNGSKTNGSVEDAMRTALLDALPALTSEKPKRSAKQPEPKLSRSEKIGLIEIPPIDMVSMGLEVIGVSPLVTNRFHGIDLIRDGEEGNRPTGRKRPPRTRDMRVAEYEGSRYRNAKGKDCVPAAWFKKAAAAMAPNFGIPVKTINGCLWIQGDLLELKFDGKKPIMREDIVYVGGKNGQRGRPMLRYRAEYRNWRCHLVVQFDKNALSPKQVVSLLAHAGAKNGLGEMSPRKGQDFGRFDIRPVKKAR